MAACAVARAAVARVHGDGQDENNTIAWLAPPISFTWRRVEVRNFDVVTRQVVTNWGDRLVLRYNIGRAYTTESALRRMAEGAPLLGRFAPPRPVRPRHAQQALLAR